MLPISVAAIFFTFGIFSSHYLGTRRSLPRWVHRTFVVTTWACTLGVIPALFNVYALSFATILPFGMALMLTALVSGVVLMRRGSRPARYFVIAFVLLSLATWCIFIGLLGRGVQCLRRELLAARLCVGVLLLAFGLADQMNTLKAEKLSAERGLLAAQAALNVELETLVGKRTAELEAANQKLTDLAITDTLTGPTTAAISTPSLKPKWRGIHATTHKWHLPAGHR